MAAGSEPRDPETTAGEVETSPDGHGSGRAAISDDTHGELITRALARFDSPIQEGQQTPIVETKMIREKAVIENEGYVLNLQFNVLSAMR